MGNGINYEHRIWLLFTLPILPNLKAKFLAADHSMLELTLVTNCGLSGHATKSKAYRRRPSIDEIEQFCRRFVIFAWSRNQ